MKPIPASSMMMFAVTTRAGLDQADPRGRDPEGRGERAAGDLLVERREPAPRHHQLQPVDADRGPERDRDHGRGAAEQDRDARHIAPQASVTAQRGRLWPDDTIRASRGRASAGRRRRRGCRAPGGRPA